MLFALTALIFVEIHSLPCCLSSHSLLLVKFAECNDMNFSSGSSSGYSTGAEFITSLKDTLRYLVEEGRAGSPKMMSIGLHCRLARPGRVAALVEFLDYAKSWGKDVWICTREEIADYWTENHYPMGAGSPVKDESGNSSTTDGKAELTDTSERSEGDAI